MKLVISTAPLTEAKQLGKQLVEEKLIACVNIVPKVMSIYTWNEELCEDEESILLMKTTAQNVPTLIERIKALHSYDVPEIVTLNLEKELCNSDYLKWVLDSVK